MVRVVAGRVEDGDADQAAGVDCCLSAIAGRRGEGGKRRVARGYGTVPLGCHMSARNFMVGGASG